MLMSNHILKYINEDYFNDIEITDDDIETQYPVANITEETDYSVIFQLSVSYNYPFNYKLLDNLVSKITKLIKIIEYYMRNCDAFTRIGNIDIVLSSHFNKVKNYSNYCVFYDENEKSLSDAYIEAHCNYLFTRPNDLSLLLMSAFVKFHKLSNIGCHSVILKNKTLDRQIKFNAGIENIFKTSNSSKAPSIWREYTNNIYVMIKHFEMSLPSFYGKCLKKYGNNNDAINYPSNFNKCAYHGDRYRVKYLRKLPKFNYIEIVQPGTGADIMAFKSESGTFQDDIIECPNWSDITLPNFKEQCHKIIQMYYQQQRDFVMLVNSYAEKTINITYVLDGTYILDGDEYVIEFVNVPLSDEPDKLIYNNAVSINMMIQTGLYDLDSAMNEYMNIYTPMSAAEAEPVRQKYIECFIKRES